MSGLSPLLGIAQKSDFDAARSAFDPTRASVYLIQVNALLKTSSSLVLKMQEGLMKIGNPRLRGKRATPDKNDELLECRMAMLGLNLGATDVGDAATLDEIRRRCVTCGYREACAVDLMRDPNSPVWETYCPNSSAIVALAQARW